MTNQPILVVSATGKTGSRVVAKLKADRPAPSGMAPITFHFAIGNREFHKAVILCDLKNVLLWARYRPTPHEGHCIR